MSLVDKLRKNTTIDATSIITESKVYGKKEMAPTAVPMVNVALSSSIDGGVAPGMLMLAGPSKHFKSAFALVMASAYLEKYEDAVILFYDSEFGAPRSYFETFNVDMNRVVHTPITDVEELKFDVMNQLKELDKDDKVMIVIDSIGNLASKKEVEDAINEKSVADMTRAKQLKSLFRMITPHLNIKDIPLITVNHTYKEIGMFPKDIVSGGTGSYYSADAIWIIGRQQEKDKTTDKDISGYKFIINIEKSRHVREKSRIPITVTFEGGIVKWSGLREVAEEEGYVVSPKKGFYQPCNPQTGELLDEKNYRAREIDNSEAFWQNVFDNTNFAEAIHMKYRVGGSGVISEDEEEYEHEAEI